MTQSELMKFDPATGKEKPYPSHAEQYRIYHGTIAWLFNPWTGRQRTAEDVGTDVHGRAIIPPDHVPLPTPGPVTPFNPTGDEWTPWSGGSRPVDAETEVEVQYRNGSTRIDQAYSVSWGHYPSSAPYDVVAYRRIKE